MTGSEAEYSVRGGVGGIAFQWEELDALLAVLRRLADSLGGTAGEIGWLRWELERLEPEGIQGYSRDGGPSRRTAAQARENTLRAQAAVLRCGDEAVTLGRELQEAINRYRLAEWAVEMTLGRLKPSPEWVWLLGGVGGQIFPPRPIGIERIPGPAQGPDAPVLLEARFESLLARTVAAGQGGIEVLRLENGTAVVAIPGTQDAGDAASLNPFNLTGIAEAMTQDSRFVSAAVAAALRDAGVAAGSAVVLVGYSQGGMHAMNLAADPDLAAEFQVRYVLTAGSPVGGEVPAASVRALHLQRLQDLVPNADGLLNPDKRNNVTATFTDPVALPEGADPGLGPAHNIDNYLDAAAGLDAGDDVSAAESAAYLAGLLGTGRAVAYRYKLSRQPEPAPKTKEAGRGTP